MSKYSIFFTMIFLVIISIISFWLNNEVKKELNIEEKKLTNNPDYFLKNFISKQTDDLGNLNFSLEAIQMNYFSYSDESILKKHKKKRSLKSIFLIFCRRIIYYLIFFLPLKSKLYRFFEVRPNLFLRRIFKISRRYLFRLPTSS